MIDKMIEWVKDNWRNVLWVIIITAFCLLAAAMDDGVRDMWWEIDQRTSYQDVEYWY